MAETVNYKLYKESSDQTNFREFREKLAGETGSNMDKIDTALKAHDDALAEKATIGDVDDVVADTIANASDDPDYDSFVGTYGIDMGGEESKQFAFEVPGACVSYRFNAGASMRDIAAKLSGSGWFSNHHLTAVFDRSTGHIVITDKDGVVQPYKVGLGTKIAEGAELTPKEFTVKNALGRMFAEKQDKIPCVAVSYDAATKTLTVKEAV